MVCSLWVRPQACWSWLALWLLSLGDGELMTASASASFDTNSPSPPASNRQYIRDWLDARIGRFDEAQNTPVLWAYKGAVYDPAMDGKPIAQVEGIELVTQWADCSSDDPSNLKVYQSKCRDLDASQILDPQKNPCFDYACTVRSRRLFCYTNNDKSAGILDSYRVRPQSPRQSLSTEQSISLWDSATTIISRPNGQIGMHTQLLNSGSDSTQKHGRSFWSFSKPKISSNDNGQTCLELAITTKPKSPKAFNYHPDLSADDNDSSSATPKRSALVQFGASQTEQNKLQYAARETYVYTYTTPKYGMSKKGWFNNPFAKSKNGSPPPAARVQYTRYGEGPSFYAPGRMCLLELTGRRINSIEQASPAIQRLIQEQIPTFANLSSHASIQVDPNAPPASWLEQRRHHLMKVIQQVKDATSISR